MSKRLFVVGVGPGSPKYLTDIAKEAIRKCHYVIGYKYTLRTIETIVDRSKQNIFEVTLWNQEAIYQDVFKKMKNNEYCIVPFTGDVSFSESEVVDRLLEIFGDDNVEIIPGISSIQVAAAKSKVPLDKAYIATFHVTGNIEKKKKELVEAISEGQSAILLPRPWFNDPSKRFMESDMAIFLKSNGINTSTLNTTVFEYLTNEEKESIFKGKASELEGKEFSDLSVLVIDQTKRQTYLDFG
ncbi:MAG: precorrin-6y C5,15-methyltransferase (decarboxylating) subunit CbiE [Nitrososphaeraceae archaeon]|nr:precorrin-6y C5,15-methyltransferase (decarboxylating) subunit CbiE [Nitrososphaeraceae archaeon]MDW0332365.1 precorrin-6y C5,15-methyltransferase (decarboxylating) subunit CbiE [Nitrososphaeraceae archaeon]